MGQKQLRKPPRVSSSNLTGVYKDPVCSPDIAPSLPPGPYHIYHTRCGGRAVFRVHVDSLRHMAFITTIFADPYPSSCPSFLNRYFRYEKIWVGGYGVQKGNSILFALDEEDDDTYNRYVYVGCSLRGFHTKSHVVSFKSVVGSYDASYPAALNAAGFYYLPETGEVITPPSGVNISEHELLHYPSRSKGIVEKTFYNLFSYTP